MMRRDGAPVKRTNCNRCFDERKPMQRFPTVKGRITWRPVCMRMLCSVDVACSAVSAHRSGWIGGTVGTHSKVHSKPLAFENALSV